MEKRNIYNIIATLSAFIINLLMQFFLSPYIVKHIGVDAYGFISVANNIVLIVDLFMVAINSMVGRFVALEVHRGNIQKASEYYSTVFLCNLVFFCLLVVVSVISIIHLDMLMYIPQRLYEDVQILFFCMLINFGISMFGALLSISYIVTNKLYLSSMIQVQGTILRGSIVLALFVVFTPHLFYYGIAVLAATIYMRIGDLYYKRKLINFIRSDNRYFDFKCLKELVDAGFFNLINRVGSVLSVNLDILLVTFLLGPIEAGILGLAKIIPNILYGITGTLVQVFFPSFLKLYAERNFKLLYLEIVKSMKIFSLIFSVPIVITWSFGDIFFRLWVPSQDAGLLYLVSISFLITMTVMGPTTLLYNVFTVVNKLQLNSLMILITGIINGLGIFYILKLQLGGLITIAVFPTCINLLRNFFFVTPYGALCIKLKWYVFYKEQIYSFVAVLITVTLGILLKKWFIIHTWGELIAASILITIVSIAIQLILVYDKKERLELGRMIKNKISNLRRVK